VLRAFEALMAWVDAVALKAASQSPDARVRWSTRLSLASETVARLGGGGVGLMKVVPTERP